MATHTALSAHEKPLRMSFQKDLSHLKLPSLSERDFQRTDEELMSTKEVSLVVHFTCTLYLWHQWTTWETVHCTDIDVNVFEWTWIPSLDFQNVIWKELLKSKIGQSLEL